MTVGSRVLVPTASFSVILLVALLGCGGGGDEHDRSSTPTATPQPTSTPTLSARAFAVESQRIVRSDDGGRTWSHPLFTSADVTLQGVAFVDRDTGWVVGGSPFGFGTAILRTTDGGATWTSQLANVSGVPRGGNGVPAGFGFFDVTFTSARHGVVVGAANQGVAIFAPPPLIVVTDDAGEHWRAVTITPIPRAGILLKVCLTAEGAGIAVGDSISGGIVVVTEDGGATWTDISVPADLRGNDLTRITGAGCAPPAQFWISGSNIRFRGSGFRTELLYSPDGGASWVDRTPSIDDDPSTYQLLPLTFVDATMGWTIPAPFPPPFDGGRTSPFILHTTDGGMHWSRQALPPGFTAALNTLAFVDERRGVAVGAGAEDPTLHSHPAAAVATTDGGETWVSASLPGEVGNLLDVTLVP